MGSDLYADIGGTVAPERYPRSPGFKRTGTSQDAAEAMIPAAARLRRRVFRAVCRKPQTADEVAKTLGESVLAIRPRTTELQQQGLIEDSGARRRNASGRRAIVWRRARRVEAVTP